ncbi:response regulator [Rhodovulum sp. 12E13]|uniref:response regulator n=1 Tax=Rhodovulum sp. 12E13 TaxID=2203891 RepID=UPI001314822D|nr:response regulator [Rhodovulum sp. 12E13]
MDEGERLREALHELQVLRERERSSHAATRALLDCVQAYATASDPTEATLALLGALARAIGAARVLILAREGGQVQVLRALAGAEAARGRPDGAARSGEGAGTATAGARASMGEGSRRGAAEDATEPPLDLFKRARNVADLSMLGAWPDAIDPAPHRSLVSAPVPGRPHRTLCALHAAPGGFSRADLALVEHLAPLLGQALAAEALADDNALLAGVIAGSPAPVAVADATRPGRPVVYVNAAQARLAGAPPEALAGRPLAALAAPPAHGAPDRVGATADSSGAVDRALFEGAVAAGLEARFLVRAGRADGTDYWADMTLFPVGVAGDDRRRHLVATQTDVTDRVEAERERDRLRARLTGALGVTEDAFLIVGAGGEVLFANAALADALPAPGPGWATGTALAENLHAFRRYAAARPADPPPGPDDLHELARSGGGRELSLPDGRSFLVRARHGADGTLVVTAANVTRLKRIEAQMRARVAAIEAARDGILLVDSAERIVYLNRAAAELLGFDAPEAGLGRDWRKRYAAPDLPGTGAVLARRTDESGRARAHEITRSPLPADGAAPPGAVLIVRDATERLADESRAADLRAALGRAQRQEAVSQLAAGLAHEFANLLATINTAAHAIGTGAAAIGAAGAPLAAPARRIEEAAARAGRLVARLRDLGAPPRAGGTADLSPLLAALPGAAGEALPRGTRLEVETGDTALPAPAAEEAAHACLGLARLVVARGAPRARLRIEIVQPESARPLDAGLLSPGCPYAALEISAPGRTTPLPALPPPAERPARADGRAPCGTTAEAAFESGAAQPRFGDPADALSLICLQARAAGGAIERGMADDGAPAFRLYWPLATGADEADGMAPGPGSPSLAGATLLVVDRDRETGEVLHAFLEGLGAEVALCDSAAIAAEAIREEPGGWTAVIADDDAPGSDVLATLRAPAPDLPLILVTAREPAAAPGTAQAGAAGVFTKPVDLAALADRLAALPPRPGPDA